MPPPRPIHFDMLKTQYHTDAGHMTSSKREEALFTYPFNIFCLVGSTGPKMTIDIIESLLKTLSTDRL